MDTRNLEFRRALYIKLLAYSKLVQPQPWKDPRPYNWTSLQKRGYCAWCGKVMEVRKKAQAVLESLNEAGRYFKSYLISNDQIRAGVRDVVTTLCLGLLQARWSVLHDARSSFCVYTSLV